MAFLLLLVCLQGLVATAADMRKLAIVSVMGDRMTVVTHRPEVGSGIDQNQRQTILLNDASFDRIAVTSATEAIIKAIPQGAPEIVAISMPGEQDTLSWLAGNRFEPPADLRTSLAATGATHLLLVTRHRAASTLKARNASLGSGHLEGLGFYIDHQKRMKRSDTGEIGSGFLAPFAYFKVCMIDVAAGEIERERAITASTTYSAARNKEGVNPWDALSAAEKIAALNKLIRSEIGKIVPEMLRAP
jgi:hypothetical protein